MEYEIRYTPEASIGLAKLEKILTSYGHYDDK